MHTQAQDFYAHLRSETFNEYIQDAEIVQKAIEDAENRLSELRATADGFTDSLVRLEMPSLNVKILASLQKTLKALRNVWECVADFKRFHRSACPLWCFVVFGLKCGPVCKMCVRECLYV